jgi:D-alanyl-lipoteichoic acid acyltransferase DltB (MBOAT superfamily)
LLRIDSIEFIAPAAAIVIALRGLPAAFGKAVYALVSVGIYLWVMPDAAAFALSLAFVYWPWLLVRRARSAPVWSVSAVVSVQTALLLWSRKYLLLVPPLAASSLVTHAVVIVGVSYIILRQVELVVWVDANPETEVSLLEYTNFTVGLFTLLAGPIVTYRDFRRGFGNRKPQTREQIAHLLNRLVNGYIKVSLLSPFLYRLSSLEHLQQQEAGTGAWLAFFYLYPWYIYLNFSGYCDVVIALAKLSYIDLPENFDRPFVATNIQNYWQRWHITFSSWIRAHIFFPLMRASRGLGRASAPFSVLLTFVIVGLWHGTDPGFAVFGVLHGIGVLIVGPYQGLLRRLLGERGLAFYESSCALRIVRTTLCYHYVCATMLFFERPLAEIWALLT